jgi:M6 family metalloprotease-like protein
MERKNTMSCLSKRRFNVILLSFLSLCGIPAFAAPYVDHPSEFSQPDGSLVTVILNGDEFYMQGETPDGYTVVRDTQTGWICYAELSADGSELLSTGVPFTGAVDTTVSMAAEKKEKKISTAKTVRKNLNITQEARLRKVKAKQKHLLGDDFEMIDGLIYPAGTAEITSFESEPIESFPSIQAAGGVLPPTKNINDFARTLRGLVLVFDFSDAPASNTLQQYYDKVNKPNAHYANGTAASLRTYYEDVSRGVFIMDHFVYGIFRAPQTFAYYDSLPYAQGARELMSYGLNDMEANGFDFSQLTTNASGEIQALAIMYTGSPAAWAEGMWYHASGWGGFSADGVHTGPYCTDNAGLNPGTLIHEHGHMAAKWPDTYSYISGEPGTWGVMGGGYCDLPNPYFLYENGWLDAENIKDNPGLKTISSVDPHFAYCYYDPDQPTEFFMIRPYTNGLLYCPNIPDQGLTFWRIYTQGNNAQYPDQDRHIELVHANNDDRNKTSNVCFKEGGLLDHFDSFTTPSSNWKFGIKIGQASGLEASDISAPGGQMTFMLGTPPEPVPYYPLDGSFSDASGSGYPANGVNFTGGQWTTDTFEDSYFDLNQSLRFDGMDDYALCPSAVSASDNLTIAFWVKPDMIGSMTPLDKFPTGSAGAGWSVRLTAGGNVSFLIGSQSNFTLVKTPMPVYEANRWTHIACTFSDGTATIYINGALRMIKHGITQSVNTTALDVRMGIPAQVDTNRIYLGLMDDVRFYDVSLESGPLNAIDGLNRKPDKGMLSFLKLDEAAGTLAKDSSGKGHDGTLTNTDFAAAAVAGKFGPAMQFDGSNDHLVIPGFIDNISELTISVWIKADDWSSNRRVMQKGNDGSEYRLLAEGGKFVFEIGATRLELPTLPPTGVWVHLAAVYDGATMRVYYDNVLQGSRARTGIIPVASGNLYIGTKNAGAIAGDRFKGVMDDIRIYNYPLSDVEVQDIYQKNRMDAPLPVSGTDEVSPEVTLTFIPADNALRHDIYFGTEYNAVLNADPQSPEYVGRKQYTEYNPPALDAWREYFWRVDELLQNGTIQTGPVWRFSTTGRIQRQVWTGLSSVNAVTGLTGSADYPDNPSLVTELDTFEIPTDWDDSYGTRVQGLLVPQTSGSYRFWISGDDEVELWLSTNADPANVSLIAYIHGSWSNPQSFDQHTSQRSAFITLQAGQPYYIMALHKEGSGGDHMAVAWQGPDSPTRQIIDSFWLRPPVGNEWPSFESTGPSLNAVEGESFSAQLTVAVSDPDGDSLSFSKQNGPKWLRIGTDGQLSGVPAHGDAGTNTFTLRVADGKGGYDDTALSIDVANRFTGAMGIEDLFGFAQDWLSLDPASPANLDQTIPVNLDDFSSLSANWNNGRVDGLVAYWSLDDTFGLTARDNYAHHHGTLINMTDYNWVPGMANNALSLDGIDDYVEIPNFKGITGPASRTCMAWIKTTEPSSQIISWGSNDSGAKWTLRVNENGTLRAEVAGGYIYGVTNLCDGRWHHVAVVLINDGSPDISEAILFVDGQPESSGSSAAYPVNTAFAENVKIGVNLTGSVFFQGLIDDISIYDRALTETEIAQAALRSLQLYLPLDETTGTAAYDVSPQQRLGQLKNGPVWQPGTGAQGGSLALDGIDDFIEIAGYKGITGPAARTCSAWIKTTKPSSQIINWGAFDPGTKWAVRVNENGTLRVEIGAGYIYGVTNLCDNTWHHVAVVLEDDGSPDISEAKLYVDGQIEPVGVLVAYPVDTGISENVKIGVNINQTVYFQGLIDDVRIYDMALTDIQVQNMY